VKLTAKGQGLLPLCEELFRRIDSFEGEINNVVLGVSGSLRIAAIPWTTQSLVPPLLSRLKTVLPGIDARIKLVTSSRMPEMLLSSEADMGLGFLTSATAKGLSLTPIKRFEIAVVMPAWHPLSSYQKVPLQSLRNEEFILTDWANAPEYHDAFVSQCLEKGLSLNITQKSPTIYASLLSVNCGAALSLIPKTNLSTLPPKRHLARLEGKALPHDELRDSQGRAGSGRC